jgi:uncharacterized protein with HEPN domain
MQREVKKYLLDIKTSIDSIYEFHGNELNFEKYKANKLLRRGVERERTRDHWRGYKQAFELTSRY